MVSVRFQYFPPLQKGFHDGISIGKSWNRVEVERKKKRDEWKRVSARQYKAPWKDGEKRVSSI